MCFSLAWLFQLLAWFIIVCAVVAALWVIVPWLTDSIDPSGRVMRIIKIIVGAVVAITLLWFVYDLIVCFGSLPRMGPGR